MSRYNVYTDGKKKVIVTSTFAKRTVRGTAKAIDEDSFDLATGIELATLRCDVKVAEKRRKCASDKIDRITARLDTLIKELDDAKDYYNDAVKAERLAQNKLEGYLEILKQRL